jgi:hypothetical protein
MKIDLIGVAERGAIRRARTLPFDTALSLTLVAGGSYTLRISVFDDAGVPEDLRGNGVRVVFTVRQKPLPGIENLIQKDGVLEAGQINVVLVQLAMADTKPIYERNLTRGVWDVWLIRGSAREIIIHTGPFHLLQPGLPPQ